MLLLFLSCTSNEKISYSDELHINIDSDGDGYTIDEDCDDTNPNIFPLQIEVCDGIDNNCNSEIDEGVQIEFFPDVDEDGFGSGDSIFSCEQPPNTVNNNSDCNDQNASIYPFATEICDGVDNNCDDQIDEDLLIIAYTDNDLDGFGDVQSPQSVCQYDENFVGDNTDCDDSNEAISPAAEELCDGLDNNCNGDTDETVTTQYFEDQDGDGFGNPDIILEECSLPIGHVENGKGEQVASWGYHGASERVLFGI